MSAKNILTYFYKIAIGFIKKIPPCAKFLTHIEYSHLFESIFDYEVKNLQFLEYINSLLWGPFGAFVILGGAVYMLMKLKIFYIIHPIKTFKSASGGATAMLSALGGSIGVGNIVGVGVALSLGGAGAVFWMWVCAIITAVLKYAEIYLSVKYAKHGVGGPMYYLRLCKISYLPEIFCALCIISSFGIGCTVQSNAVALSAKHLGISDASVGIVLAFLCLITFSGGGKRLQKVCNLLVPLMSILYIGFCVLIIALKIKQFPHMISDIIKSAFDFKSALGGIGASLFVRGLKEGMSKGIFSAESGMGSSAIMYSFNCPKKPENQGVWGILEVFIDTVVMCSLTAFALLLTNSDNVFSAFSLYFGKFGGLFTFISLFCFAYTSICCWNFYASSCIGVLAKRKWALFVYNALFSISIYIGAISSTSGVWLLSDLCNAIMLFVNFYGMLKLSSRIKSPL